MALRLFSLPNIVVATGGTTYPLSTTRLFSASVTLQADFNNVGRISVGGPEISPGQGIQISPGDSAVIEYPASAGFADEFDLSKIYITSATANDTVRITYIKRE